MEIIFGQNKKEQLEPVQAKVTGETSVFRWAFSSPPPPPFIPHPHSHLHLPCPMLEVAFGSLETHIWQQDEPVSRNSLCNQ
jgi:hypothetical protein